MLLLHPVALAIAITHGVQAAATSGNNGTTVGFPGPSPPEYHDNVEDPGGLPPCHGTAAARRLARKDTHNIDIEIRDGESSDPAGNDGKHGTWPSDYIPAKCTELGYNCVYVQPGVWFAGGPSPIEIWPRADRTQVMVFRYWQSEVVFTAIGGTAVTYLAHDTIWTCAKGLMHAETIIAGGDVTGPRDLHLYNCVCTYILSDDLVIWAEMYDPAPS
ncbi:hypothetical protein diail_8141 [Diaporthe ilicicola]|nr:hypothetical protein diail_8141 [Diaporthe ilicicola]